MPVGLWYNGNQGICSPNAVNQRYGEPKVRPLLRIALLPRAVLLIDPGPICSHAQQDDALPFPNRAMHPNRTPSPSTVRTSTYSYLLNKWGAVCVRAALLPAHTPTSPGLLRRYIYSTQENRLNKILTENRNCTWLGDGERIVKTK